MWHELRSLVAVLTDILRSGLPYGAQVTSCPQTAASTAGNEPTSTHVVVCRGLLRRGT
jgi:hypothetical protein